MKFDTKINDFGEILLWKSPKIRQITSKNEIPEKLRSKLKIAECSDIKQHCRVPTKKESMENSEISLKG